MNKFPPSSGVGVGMSEHTLSQGKSCRAYFSLTFTPLTKDDTLIERPDMFVLNSDFALIAYAPTDYVRSYNKKIFVLRGGPRSLKDIARNRRFSSYENFMKCAERNPMLNFVAKCTTISPLVFELAFQNIGVAIPVGIVYEKYLSLCGGETLMYDYKVVEAYKNAMRDRFDKARLERAKKKYGEKPLPE